jgi:hypothetical protein
MEALSRVGLKGLEEPLVTGVTLTPLALAAGMSSPCLLLWALPVQ